MSSREQLKDYVNGLKARIRELDLENTQLKISLDNSRRIHNIKDFEVRTIKIDMKRKNERICSLEEKLRKEKRWYQIII